MTRRLLTIGYPLARMGPDAVGGAEQIMTSVEAAAVAAGWRSFVVAPEGSRPAGTLIPLALPSPPYDAATIAATRRRAREVVAEIVEGHAFDLVHVHGFDFAHYLPPPGPPTLVTLHCPADWYAQEALRSARPHTWFHGVSRQQHRALAAEANLLPPIENGVTSAPRRHPVRPRGFALILSRIAPEKGIREALDAAHDADMPLLIAGEVFPYPEHVRYLREEIEPRLDRRRRLIGPVGQRGKSRLLQAAACLMVTSSVPETSSLAAREAIAAGTPVVGLRRGALCETVEHGSTGILVDHPEDLSAALRQVHQLSRDTCRRFGARAFDIGRMTRAYLDLYERLTARTLTDATAPWP